jgi:hypothetical protein
MFLCGEKPILLLEDLDLSRIECGLPFHLFIYPYFVGKTDGTPVIALAEMI